MVGFCSAGHIWGRVSNLNAQIKNHVQDNDAMHVDSKGDDYSRLQNPLFKALDALNTGIMISMFLCGSIGKEQNSVLSGVGYASPGLPP